MEGAIDAGAWLAIANVVCNTFQVVALAYIGTLAYRTRNGD
jgi:hypothetical protein